jgi:hypothetical protein
MGILTFKTWLEKTHPEAIEEGLGRNLLTAGLVGLAGLSSGCSKNTPPAPQHNQSSYNQVFHSPKREAARRHRQDNIDQLKTVGRSSGQFVGGKLQPLQSSQKTFTNSKVTSPEAASFLQ